ncbi:XRE family transcriptional regulator [Nocardia sp. SYP-A9097]|uniref:helix-turn-helix domain-containing protein n=1 Tax=Nocardia sp. SYP-A9097 TaxID=2663237 RepID=UPI00129B557A|nr:helix-turn-helix transcriptional regulator [Nocardia sp. SYP-A9097]MRH91575.1 XRE family transcriptional regulator [Nocardia sp. SYP-A9097]
MAGSTVTRMDLATVMKRLRLEAGKVPLAAATHLDKSRQVIVRLEDGRPTSLSRPQIESLLDFYGASAEVRASVLGLWNEVKKEDRERGDSRGFWTEYTDQISPQFDRYLRLEESADHIVAYHPVIVPGLLQGPDYRRAIIKIDSSALSAVDMERRLELTARRQVRLSEGDLRVEAFLSEAVLRNQVGGPFVMATQLRWVAELSERANITVRIIEFGIPSHQGLTVSPFTRLGFPPGVSGLTKPSVVYVESAFAISYHEREPVVSRYEEAISALRSVALTETDTSEYLVRMAKEYAQ